ncbi:chemotaxis protein CheW [Desulfovibrio sp. DV]|uniref:chemotaxis protein CheW n=1 Tax=Desulfovibrio sp. DV TaxID=1844708 RepID=UPI00094BA236|nr:chemotaxis protein CheW [Desulfovibrio sp. DV]
MDETTIAKQENELLQLVTFGIGEEEYGIDILEVQEIIRIMDITKIPNSPPHVEGVITLRGKVIPVIGLRCRFNMESRPHDSQTRIIVVDIRGIIIGFLVDGVSEVLRIQSNTVEPPPPVASGVESEYIKGVGKLDDRLLILLDLDKLIPTEELTQH